MLACRMSDFKDRVNLKAATYDTERVSATHFAHIAAACDWKARLPLRTVL